MKKYKKNFNRDYEFYLLNKEKFKFSGSEIQKIDFDINLDVKEAFWNFDSKGILTPCSNPLLLKELINCKKAINLQLAMWSDGYFDCLIPISELLESFTGEIPEWIIISLKNQINKKIKTERKK